MLVYRHRPTWPPLVCELIGISYRRLFYKCMQCRHVYKDPNAEEGPQKEVQRRQRDERVRNANNPVGGKSDERPKKVTRPPPETGGTAERTAVANHIVVKEDNSDDEY